MVPQKGKLAVGKLASLDLIGLDSGVATYFLESTAGETGSTRPCCKPKYRSSMSEDTPSFDLML